MSEEVKFWVVWAPKRELPTKRHTNQASAEAEAIRLAKDRPGAEFFVLEAMTIFTTDVVIHFRGLK